jgi:Secretion system C-terminal sorting domain
MQHLYALRLRCAALLFLIFISSGSLLAQTHTFLGTAPWDPTNWFESFNWLGNNQPFSAVANLDIHINNTCNRRFNFILTSSSVLNVNVGEFQLSNSASFQNDGTMNMLSSTGFNFNIGTTLTNNNVLNISNGTFPVFNGTMNNIGVTNYAAPGQISINGHWINSGTLNNNGNRITVQSSGSFTNTGILSNPAGRNFDVLGTMTMSTTDIENGGNFSVWAGTGTLDIGNKSLKNTGNINISGTVNINNTVNEGIVNNAGGVTNIGVGGIVNLINGALINNNQMTNSGTINQTGGVFQLNTGTLTSDGNTNLTGGSGSNSAHIAVTGGTFGTSGTHNFANNGIGTISVASGATANLGGTFNNLGTITNNGTMTVPTGGTFQQDGTLSQNGTFTVNGTFTGNNGCNGNLINNGQLTPKSALGNIGTMAIGGDFTQNTTGNIHIDMTGTGAGQFDKIEVTGVATLGGTITVSGTPPPICGEIEVMTFASSTGSFTGVSGIGGYWSVVYTPTSVKIKYHGTEFNFVGGGGNQLWSNPNNWEGCIAPSGTVNFPVKIVADCTLDVPVTMNANLQVVPGFVFSQQQPLTINATHTFLMHNILISTANLTVAGTFDLKGAAIISGGTHVFSGAFNHSTVGGDLEIKDNATVTFSGSFTSSGEEVTFLNSNITISGTFTNNIAVLPVVFTNCNVTVSGTVTNNGNYIQFNASWASAFELQVGGQLTSTAGGMSICQYPGPVLAGNITNSGTSLFYMGSPGTFTGTLTNSGTFDIYQSLDNNGTINNNAGGTMTIQPSRTLTNNGTFNNAVGATFTVVNGAFFNNNNLLNNAGTIALIGTMSVSSASVFTNNGTVSGTAITNPGLIKGTGTFSVSNFTNNGTLEPGNTLGTMSSGPTTLSGIFNVEFSTAPIAFDALAVTGNLTLSGTLNISNVSGGLTPTCSVFTILTYSSRSGTFSTINWPPGTVAADWVIVYGPTSATIRYGFEPTLRIFDGGGSDDFWMNHDNWVNCVATPNVTVNTNIASDCILDVNVSNNANCIIESGNNLNINGYNFTNNAGGTVDLRGTLTQTTGSLIQNGQLKGSGLFIGHLTNNGTIQPGDGTWPYTPLRVQGNFTQTPTSIVSTRLFWYSTQHDRIEITDNAVFAGTLQLSLANGFVPVPCSEFSLITYGSHTGTFSQFTAPGLPGDWELIYTPTALKVKYVGTDVHTFTGAVSSAWNDPANWAECRVPSGMVNNPVTIAADCILDHAAIAMNANLTINNGKKLTLRDNGELSIGAGHTLTNNGTLENNTHLDVEGILNFSNTNIYINHGDFFCENDAFDLVLLGNITNTGSLVLRTRSVDIQTNVPSTGTGSFTIDAKTLINFSTAYTVSAVDGNINWKANEQGNTGTTVSGIRIENGAVTTSGTGNITLLGQGQSGLFDVHGVWLNGAGARVEATGTGNISISGTAGDTNAGVDGYGVYISNGPLVKTASGNIGVVAYGGNLPNSISSSAFLIQSANITAEGSGNIAITAIGEESSRRSYGFNITLNAQITTTDGDITIKGEAGNGLTGSNYGINLDLIGSTNPYLRILGSGYLFLEGTGGDFGSNNHGIHIDAQSGFGKPFTTNGGDISIIGIGGGSGTGDSDGFRMSAGSNNQNIATLATGNISITATGGAGGTGDNDGIQLSGIIAADAGNITIVANAGDGNSAGFKHAGSNIASNTGSLTITATGSGTGAGISGGFQGIFGKNTSTGPITLICDSFDGSTITTSGTAVIRPITPSRSIGIGDGTPGDLHFSNSEMNSFYLPWLTIGDAVTGTGLVSVNINNTLGYAVHFVGGDVEMGQVIAQDGATKKDISCTARIGDIKGITGGNGTSYISGNIINLVAPNGKIRPGNSPGIIQLEQNYIHTGNLEIEIAGTTGAGQTGGHDQLRTVSSTALTTLGGTLTVAPIDGFVPTAGQSFVIVDAQNGGAITGTFDNIVSPGFAWNVTYTPTQVILMFSALPVELVDFSAKNEEKTVLLQWQTASEVNADYFEVEHSTDGARFETIGSVKAAGNSTTLQRYQLRHEQPKAGLNYYRLRQVDLDGGVELSHIVSVDRGADGGIRVFPNPVHAYGRAAMHCGSTIGNTTAQIFDATGRLIYSTPIAEGDNLLNISNLNTGVYLVRVGEWTERLVVIE